jgi:hypothetical protein
VVLTTVAEPANDIRFHFVSETRVRFLPPRDKTVWDFVIPGAGIGMWAGLAFGIWWFYEVIAAHRADLCPYLVGPHKIEACIQGGWGTDLWMMGPISAAVIGTIVVVAKIRRANTRNADIGDRIQRQFYR